MKRVVAGVLDVAYVEVGPPDGIPVILLHGFPYDVHAYDAAAEHLAAAGRRCIIPFLRGYGPTRFLATDTPRSGQQAALGVDVLALMDALGFQAQCSLAMIGVVGLLALWLLFGLSGCEDWSAVGQATTSRILRVGGRPSLPSRNTAPGTCITLIRSADGLVSISIGIHCAA